MKTVECKIRVRYSETGSRGYAHHSSFFNWFDISLEEIVRLGGSSYGEIEELGYMLAPIADSCKYYHPASYNDELTIRVTVVDLSGIKIKFAYEVIREKDAQLVAKGTTEHVFVDKSFKPHSLKHIMPKLFSMLEDMIQPEL